MEKVKNNEHANCKPLQALKRVIKEDRKKKDYIDLVIHASRIGSFMYEIICMRPHTMIASNMKGTINNLQKFQRADFKLHGYVDVDLGGDLDTLRSTTRSIYIVGYVNWVSYL